MSELYRLVYTSQSLLRGSEEERAAAVAQILAVSQRNNARLGVSGALLFSCGGFAQVLEGPRAAVEATFERIQRDRRHSDVSVLQCEPVEGRGFPHWSMAFAGRSARGRALWDDIAERTGFDPSRMDGDHLFATLMSIVVDEEGLTDEALAAPPVDVSAPDGSRPQPRSRVFDVGRLRSELLEQTPEQPSSPVHARAAKGPAAVPRPEPAGKRPFAPQTEVAVLRAALDEERARTTELRRALDDAHVALASAACEIDALRRRRDTSVECARALVAALSGDPQALDDEGLAEMRAVG